jgi:hypothetical protein
MLRKLLPGGPGAEQIFAEVKSLKINKSFAEDGNWLAPPDARKPCARATERLIVPHGPSE